MSRRAVSRRTESATQRLTRLAGNLAVAEACRPGLAMLVEDLEAGVVAPQLVPIYGPGGVREELRDCIQHRLVYPTHVLAENRDAELAHQRAQLARLDAEIEQLRAGYAAAKLAVFGVA